RTAGSSARRRPPAPTARCAPAAPAAGGARACPTAERWDGRGRSRRSGYRGAVLRPAPVEHVPRTPGEDADDDETNEHHEEEPQGCLPPAGQRVQRPERDGTEGGDD